MENKKIIENNMQDEEFKEVFSNIKDEILNAQYKPEYVGKLNFYLSAVDDLLKSENDNLSIGIILCREKKKFSVEYSLRDINKPIGVSSYEVSNILPKDIMEALPTEEDLNLHIDIIENGEDN